MGDESVPHVGHKKRKRVEDALGKEDMTGERTDAPLKHDEEPSLPVYVADKHVLVVLEGDLFFSEPRAVKVPRQEIAEFDRKNVVPFMELLEHVCKCAKTDIDRDANNLVNYILKSVLKVPMYPTMSLANYVTKKEWVLCNGVAVVSTQNTTTGQSWQGDGTEHVLVLDVTNEWMCDVRKAPESYQWNAESARTTSAFELEIEAPPDVVATKVVFADNLRVNGVMTVEEQYLLSSSP